MPIFIPLICLLGMGVAAFRQPAQAVPADPAVPDDMPVRLLRCAIGLLSAQRDEWGQAMLGELDHIDGRGRRWRFAVGCAGAAVLMPPWGRAAAAVWAMAAVAAASAGLYASVGARFGLGTGDWVIAAIALALLAGYTLTASVLLRRPGIAFPGLLGGLLVALAWLVPYGFSFSGLITGVAPLWAVLAQGIVVPLLAGVAGTLWGGDAVAGRRIARLAGLSAGLGLFLYATLAVAVLGAAGARGSGWTVSATIDDQLGNNAIFYLWLVPLVTAALGWAAAGATARLYPRLAITVAATAAAPPLPGAPPLRAAGEQGAESLNPMAPPQPAAARARSWRRTARRILQVCAIVAAIVIMVAVALLKG
jgi:hypothetical protein